MERITNNPSPSGDSWFLDSKNIAEVEKGLADIKGGRVRKRTLAEIKEIVVSKSSAFHL